MPETVLGLIALLLSVSPAATPTPPARYPLDASVVLAVPGMERVTVRSDLVYSTPEGGAPLKADVYLPPDAVKGRRYPVVLLIAGGAENTKEWGIYKSLGRLLAASGFAAVPFNHRLRYPRRQYEQGEADVLAVLDFLRRNSESLAVDPDRVGALAFSGGGPMLSVFLRRSIPGVRCLAGYYAFLDTDHVDPAEAGASVDVIHAFSPLRRFLEKPEALPPLFIARAGRDDIPGVNASIDRFVGAALERNAPVALVNHPTGVHGFDHRNDDARSREILRLTLEFLRSHLSSSGRDAAQGRSRTTGSPVGR